MLLVRIAFWVAVIAFLLPTAPDTAPRGNGPSGHVRTTSLEPQDAVNLSMAIGSDVAGFCGRNPQVCATARDAGRHIVSQVVFYGGAAFDWASEAAEDAARHQDNGGGGLGV